MTTCEPEVTAADMVRFHQRQLLRWLVAAMPESGVEEMYQRLKEIADHAKDSQAKQ